MEIKTTAEWADDVFGNCDLGDTRRVARLVSYAALQAEDPGASTSGACKAKSAEAEGAYRLLRNDSVSVGDIDDGAFDSIAAACNSHDVVLAIEDTTTVEVAHDPLWESLKENGCVAGFQVHSTLMVNAATGETIGLADQQRWIRDKVRSGRDKRRERSYEEKESFKWQSAHQRLAQRLGKKLADVITVCDREADIYENIQYHRKENSRFLIRCSENRRTAGNGKLWEDMEQLPLLGNRELLIQQRGPSKQFGKTVRPGRRKRKIVLEVRAGQVTILWPKNRKPDGAQPLTVNAVYVKETNPLDGEEPVIWRLLTSEPVESFEQTSRVIGYYEKRWLIEEYHKCWKSGCRVEKRAFQSLDCIERFLAISAHIAVRILTIKTIAESAEPDRPATLSDEEWHCLHTCAYGPDKKAKPTPSVKTVYGAVATLGGFLDTKQTGRAGWQTLWKGWTRFQEFLNAWRMAKNFYSAGVKM